LRLVYLTNTSRCQYVSTNCQLLTVFPDEVYNQRHYMTEGPTSFHEFDAQVAGQALGAEPHATRDVAHGDGAAIDVGEAVLEVYRDAGVARVTTPDARIELFRVPSYNVNGERVVFEQGTEDDRSRLMVRRDGKVSFYPVLRATEASQTQERASGGRQDSPTPQTASEGVTRQTGTATSPEGGEAEPIQLQGHLGRDPWYSDRGEQPAAGFPLAVHGDRGQTTWHRVLVFGEVAEQLNGEAKAEKIRKGRLVQVSGFEVTRPEATPQGGTRPVKEFHATSVMRMTTRTVPHPQGR
jgi:Single-strand binding protein family